MAAAAVSTRARCAQPWTRERPGTARRAAERLSRGCRASSAHRCGFAGRSALAPARRARSFRPRPRLHVGGRAGAAGAHQTLQHLMTRSDAKQIAALVEATAKRWSPRLQLSAERNRRIKWSGTGHANVIDRRFLEDRSAHSGRSQCDTSRRRQAAEATPTVHSGHEQSSPA